MRPLPLRRWAASFGHAFDGVMDAYRSQRHMRVHFVFMALNAILAMLYKLNTIEVALVTICVAFVVFAEMLNTVIEAVLNMVCETYHPIARFAKDVAAGAVLVAALNSVVVGACIYATPERLGRLRTIWVTGGYPDSSATLRAVAITFVLLLVTIAAAKVGKKEGSVLEGGPVSGNTALAFCAATTVFFVVRDTTYALVATFLSLVIAILVANMRLHDHTHRVRTVVYGAVLGVLIPLVVFELLSGRG